MSKSRFKRIQLRLTASEPQRELEGADADLMEAVVAACALVAYWDGWHAQTDFAA